MKKFSATVLCVAIAMASFSFSASAAVVTNQSGGVATPSYAIDFSGQAQGTDLSNVYSAQGLTLTGLSATNGFGNNFAPTTAPAAINFGSGAPVEFGFSFASAVSDVSFFLVTDNFGTTITSYLNGVVVESFFVGAFNGASSFQGFTNTMIDQVKFNVAGDGLALIDNLSVVNASAVPEPTSIALIGLGLFAAAGMRRRKA